MKDNIIPLNEHPDCEKIKQMLSTGEIRIGCPLDVEASEWTDEKIAEFKKAVISIRDSELRSKE